MKMTEVHFQGFANVDHLKRFIELEHSVLCSVSEALLGVVVDMMSFNMYSRVVSPGRRI